MENINEITLTLEDELAMAEAYWYGTPYYEAEIAYIKAKMAEQNA